MMRISEIISEMYSGFTKGQRLLAAFVLEHCDKAAFMSSFELASVSGVSQSTVMRFATALGFDGFRLFLALRSCRTTPMTTTSFAALRRPMP